MTAETSVSVGAVDPPGGKQGLWLLLGGQFTSVLGSALVRFAVGVWVFQASGLATQFALTTLAGTLPLLLASPVAGALIDRWPRRFTLAASTTGGLLSALLLAFFLQGGPLRPWQAYLTTAIGALFAAFEIPAVQATVPIFVARENLGRANGFVQLSWGGGQLLAPAIGGLLIAAVHPQVVVAIAGALYLLALGAFALLALPQRVAAAAQGFGAVLQDFLSGLRYLAARPALLDLMLLFAVVNFFLGIVLALSAPLVLSSFTPAVLGMVMTIGGVGMIAGSITLGPLGKWGRPTVHVLLGTIASGVFLALAGVRPSIPLIVIGCFGVFFWGQVVDGMLAVIFQTKVGQEMHGRIFSVSLMIGQSTLPLATLVAGPLADKVFEPRLLAGGSLAASVGTLIGVGKGRGIGLIFILAGLLTTIAGVAGWLRPRVRRLDFDLPDAAPQAANAPSEGLLPASTPTAAS